MENENLREFVCHKCGKKLIWAYETSIIQCNNCHRLVRFKDIKLPNPCKLNPKSDEEQLELF